MIHITIKETRGSWYGKSQYGGWYINSFDGKYQYHGQTLREIKEHAKREGIDLAIREDH